MAEETRFLVALVIPDHIRVEIVDFAEGVFAKFQAEVELKSPPHISLHKPFFWADKDLDLLKDKLTKFKSANMYFELTIRNFDYDEFDQIIVDVIQSKKLSALQKEFSIFAKNELGLPTDEQSKNGFSPIVNIGAKELKKYLYGDARKRFQEHKYKASYRVMDLCLLKHNGEHWEEELYF